MDYKSYLHIENLLSSQVPRSDYQREETLFIITHQAIELWLKMLLLEIDFLKKSFQTYTFYRVLGHIERAILFLNLMSTQFNALHGLSPLEFARMRPALGTASGMQSEQYKLLNQSLGIAELLPNSTDVSLRSIVSEFLLAQQKQRDLDENNLLENLKTLYIEDHELTVLMDKLIQMDEAFIQWKRQHLDIVKRMIGNVQGTGGTSLDWLINRIQKPVFVELWQMKDLL